MNIILYNTIAYIVEFIKIFLVSTFLLKIEIKNKKVAIYTSMASVIFVAVVSVWFDLYEYAILFGVISIFVMLANIREKKKIGMVAFSYVGICIVDMVIGAIIMFAIDTDLNTVVSQEWYTIVINSISIILIILLVLIFSKKGKINRGYSLSGKYLMLYIIGGIALGIYLTAIQISLFGEELDTYKKWAGLGISISSVVFVIICALFIVSKNQNKYLKIESDINQEMIKSQQEYYLMLLRKEEETKRFRHDIQEHLYCMNSLLKDKEYAQLEEYFSKVNTSFKELKKEVNTGNKLVDIIINSIKAKYTNVDIVWKGRMPDDIEISSMDLCTVVSNLLRNAFEAAESADEKKVTVSAKFFETNLIMVVENHYSIEPVVVNGKIISAKKEKNHGYGIKNVKSCIEKYNGSLETSFENGIFSAEVIFNNVVKV